DARPAPGAVPEGRTGRRADQGLHAPRDQGESALPARRPLPHAGGRRGVLQPDSGTEAERRRQEGPDRVPSLPIDRIPRPESRDQEPPSPCLPGERAPEGEMCSVLTRPGFGSQNWWKAERPI